MSKVTSMSRANLIEKKDGPWLYVDSSNAKFYYYENGQLARGSPFLRVDEHWHQGVINSIGQE